MNGADPKRFDVVFGLGSACSCTQTLRTAGLQFASFPFDWLLGSDLVSRTHRLLDGFRDAFEQADFEEVPNPDAFRHASYLNRRTGFYHFHDFEQGVPLSDQLPSVREKYQRRRERLLALLARADRALVVWMGDPRDAPPPSDAEIAESLRLMRERFPRVAFSYLVFDCLRGVAAADAKVSVSMTRTRVSFDYRRPNAENDWEVCPEWLLPHLAAYSVVDYRTREQKRAHARADRMRDRERFPAKTRVGHWLTKLEFKIYRHLRKRLERRGMKL